MQNFSSLEYSQFLTRAHSGAVAVTVDPGLAHQVMRTRLIATKFKRELLKSTDATASTIIIECAKESELFYDIMVELGVMLVHETT